MTVITISTDRHGHFAILADIGFPLVDRTLPNAAPATLDSPSLSSTALCAARAHSVIQLARAALRRVEEAVLKDHVSHCVEHAIASGDKSDQRQKISELMVVIGRADR